MQEKQGIVKWFDKDKGYGFILNENENEDIFVHYSQIQIKGFKDLNQGDIVKFDLVETDKGYLAKNVKIIKVNLKNHENKKMASK